MFTSSNSHSNMNYFCSSSLLFFLLGCTRPKEFLTDLSFQEATVHQLRETPDPFLMEDNVFTETYWDAKHHFGELGKVLRTLETSTESMSLQHLMMSLFAGWDR